MLRAYYTVARAHPLFLAVRHFRLLKLYNENINIKTVNDLVISLTYHKNTPIWVCSKLILKLFWSSNFKLETVGIFCTTVCDLITS